MSRRRFLHIILRFYLEQFFFSFILHQYTLVIVRTDLVVRQSSHRYQCYRADVENGEILSVILKNYNLSTGRFNGQGTHYIVNHQHF